MEYSYRYLGKLLAVEIEENSVSLSDIDIDDLVSEILDLIREARKCVIFDLKGKKHFNSADLGALIKSKDLLSDNGIDLVLMHPSENIMELLKIVGLMDFIRIIKSEDDLTEC